MYRYIFLTVIKIHHFFLFEGSINLFKIDNFGDILPCYENNSEILFRVILLLSRQTDLCLVEMETTKYLVYLSFLDPQPKFN